ncbi:MAG: hypothetical protein JXR40_14230 [Pontiellaceae bacterium]|nr:hypothetical protein [Pontiellaceae bacterium]
MRVKPVPSLLIGALFTATTAVTAATAGAQSITWDDIKHVGGGTIAGRIQSLSMLRDYENVGNGQNSTMGIVLGYTTPEMGPVSAGVVYNYAGTLYDNNRHSMLANDDIHVLNEAWIKLQLEALGLEDSELLAGRKVLNGELFRTDDFRQKARSAEVVQLTTGLIPDTVLTVGHSIRFSSWIQAGDRWNFNDYSDVFGTAYDTDGISYVEMVNKSVDEIEVALYNAAAWDVANLTGARLKYQLTDETALLGYFRMESDIGKGANHESSAGGLSVQQKVGAVTLEGGYFGAHGDNMKFQTLTTGINHALGPSMMVYAGQFNGGADTAYAKATTTLEGTGTVLYALYNHSWQQKAGYDGQELNIVVKQPIGDSFAITFKGAIGYRDSKTGADTKATDARLFITYSF